MMMMIQYVLSTRDVKPTAFWLKWAHCIYITHHILKPSHPPHTSIERNTYKGTYKCHQIVEGIVHPSYHRSPVQGYQVDHWSLVQGSQADHRSPV